MIKCGYCGAELQSKEEAGSHLMKHWMEQAERNQQKAQQTYLLMAASQLTQICLVSGRKPEEAMEVFSRLYELLKDWRGELQSKDGFVSWLDSQWGKVEGDEASG
ncbi:hypothetical protein ACFLWX_02800 [Chloroflexota bacterium]